MNYLAFLQALLALGPKLPKVIEYIQHIISDVKEIIALLQPGPFAAERVAQTTALVDGVAVNAEVLAEETKVLALLPREVVSESNREVFASADGESLRGIGDGTFLRMIFAFVQAHPELLTLLLSLLAKK